MLTNSTIKKLIQKSLPVLVALLLSGALLTAAYRSAVDSNERSIARTKAATNITIATHHASASDLHPTKQQDHETTSAY